MAQQLFIPDRINVGFQNRKDTYTGKLAYVIYFDQKGVLRKEASWKSWRDKSIDPIEYPNEPTEGFVLNKKVGGTKGHCWEQRNTYVRVYDPRGFEFEISIPNLLFILSECDCSRGKGLEGKFVYAWDGTDLVLLPETSADYYTSKAHTDLLAQKVKAKELVLGGTYLTKDLRSLTYLGRFEHYEPQKVNYRGKIEGGMTRPYVFWTGERFEFHSGMAKLGKLLCDTPVGNYAELVEAYRNTINGSKVVRIYLTEGQPHDRCWFREEDGKFARYSTHRQGFYDDTRSPIQHIDRYDMFTVKDGVLVLERNHGRAWSPEHRALEEQRRRTNYWYSGRTQKPENTIPWVEPTNLVLRVVMENGMECEYGYWGLTPVTKEETNGTD